MPPPPGESVLHALIPILAEVEKEDGRLWIRHEEATETIRFAIVSATDKQRAVYFRTPVSVADQWGGDALFVSWIRDLAERYLDMRNPIIGLRDF